MTQANIQELAKQGDAKALATLWNRQLQPKGIAVKTNLASGCLMVIAESKDVPDQALLVDFIRKSITNLKIDVIGRVAIQGRVAGNATPAWREAFDLPSPVTPPTEPEPAVSTNSSASVKPPKVSFNSPINPPKNDIFTTFLNFVKEAKELINTGLLLGILLVLIANYLGISRSQRTFWEYKVESVEDSAFELTMHRMGAEGWELASARRAVSGEGSSSRGLYEVIFKRPATKAQIQENGRKLESLLQESKLRSKEILAKLNVGSTNRAQQANYTEKGTLALTIEELGTGLKLDSEDYIYNFTADSTKSVLNATPKTDGIKSYVGAVFLVEQNGTTNTVTVTCESDSPSRTSLESPILNGSEPVCPAGSSKAD